MSNLNRQADQPAVQATDERAMFEAAHPHYALNRNLVDGHYCAWVQNVWDGWQARAALVAPAPAPWPVDTWQERIYVEATRKPVGEYESAMCAEIADLRAALAAQPTPIEPVGWLYGKSYYEVGNPRLTEHIKEFGDARFAAQPAPVSVALRICDPGTYQGEDGTTCLYCGVGITEIAQPSPQAPDVARDAGAVEVAAKFIYKSFPGADAHPWREGVNSNKQDDARRLARAAIAQEKAQ